MEKSRRELSGTVHSFSFISFFSLPAKTSKLSTTGTGHLSGYPKT